MESVRDGGGDEPDVIELCDAFLFLMVSSETGDLAEALGDDAPSGLLEAIETLNNPELRVRRVATGASRLR